MRENNKNKHYKMANEDLEYNGRPCFLDHGDCRLYFPTGAPEGYKVNVYKPKPLREWHDVLWSGNVWDNAFKFAAKAKRHGGRFSD